MSSNTDSTQRDRRLTPRARIETRATVHLANEELVCRTRDLSAEGLALVVDESSAPSGTFMRVHLKLPDERQALDLDGILVRTDPQSTGIVWGLRFLEYKAGVQTKIEQYIRASALRSSASHSVPGEGFTSVGGSSSARIGLPPGSSSEPEN